MGGGYSRFKVRFVAKFCAWLPGMILGVLLRASSSIVPAGFDLIRPPPIDVREVSVRAY
jgi:hypothetical protein